MPGQPVNEQQASQPAASQQPSTVAKDSPAEAGLRGTNGQTSPTAPSGLPPPRTPPLSVEQSRRLIENVAQMPAMARQHPQVRADEAQARAVVNAESQNNTEGAASKESPPNVREPEPQGAIPPPGNLPPLPDWVSPHLVAAWDENLAAARVRDPADHTEILRVENLGPLSRLHVYRAVQSFLDLLPGDITRSLPRFYMRGASEAELMAEVGHDASGAWSPKDAIIYLSHDLVGDETLLRTVVWHEMTHWLWDGARRQDAPPRLAEWRRDLERHFRERTANAQMRFNKKGFYYLGDHWIDDYAGKISKKPTNGAIVDPSPIELATTYMEKFAKGGAGPASWEIVKNSDSTFHLVFSILGDK